MKKDLEKLIKMISKIHKRDLIDWIVVACFILGGAASLIILLQFFGIIQ